MMCIAAEIARTASLATLMRCSKITECFYRTVDSSRFFWTSLQCSLTVYKIGFKYR